MSEKSSVRELVAIVAGPREWSDTRESWFQRAARRSQLSFRTIRSIWYGEITDEGHHAVRLLRHAAERQAAQQFESIAASLRAIDPEFHSPRIAQYLDLARALRDLENSQRAEVGAAEAGRGDVEGVHEVDREG